MQRKKGFTLIELLVVIAIIGILASVVLASLNTARDKGSDAAVKANLVNIRAQSELIYDDNGRSYDSVCTDGNVVTMTAAAEDATGNTSVCNDTASAWAASIQLKSTTDYFCVDSTGKSTTTSTALGSGTVCS